MNKIYRSPSSRENSIVADMPYGPDGISPGERSLSERIAAENLQSPNLQHALSKAPINPREQLIVPDQLTGREPIFNVENPVVPVYYPGYGPAGPKGQHPIVFTNTI